MTTFTYGTSGAPTSTYSITVTRYNESGVATTDSVAGRTWTSLSSRIGNGDSSTADSLVMTSGNDLFVWDDYTTSTPGGALNGSGEFYAFQNSSRTRAIETIAAGSGNDLVNLTYEASGQTYWQWDSAAGGANASMWVDGGVGDDIIWGHNPGEFLYGGADNDWIDGGAGNDSLFGGAGNDSVVGGLGNDRLQGDDGNDTLIDTSGNNLMYGGLGDDTAYGGTGNDTIQGDDGDDLISDAGGTNTLYGGVGNDFIYGGAGTDSAFGGDGNDAMSGFDGNDSLDGGLNDDGLWGVNGTDTLYGGANNDFLYGGAGDGDTMFGGAGDDYYYFARGDGTGDIISDSGGTNTIVAFGGFAAASAVRRLRRCERRPVVDPRHRRVGQQRRHLGQRAGRYRLGRVDQLRRRQCLHPEHPRLGRGLDHRRRRRGPAHHPLELRQHRAQPDPGSLRLER